MSLRFITDLSDISHSELSVVGFVKNQGRINGSFADPEVLRVGLRVA